MDRQLLPAPSLTSFAHAAVGGNLRIAMERLVETSSEEGNARDMSAAFWEGKRRE